MTAQNNDFTHQDGVSLKCYTDTRFDAMEEKFDVIMRGQERAITLAREGMERRLEGMNEFRDTLKDQTSKFVTRGELEVLLAGVAEAIKTAARGKVSWGIALALTVLTSAVLSLVILLVTLGLK